MQSTAKQKMRKIKEGQSNKEILKIKTAARSLSTGTQQLYAKGRRKWKRRKIEGLGTIIPGN